MHVCVPVCMLAYIVSRYAHIVSIIQYEVDMIIVVKLILCACLYVCLYLHVCVCMLGILHLLNCSVVIATASATISISVTGGEEIVRLGLGQVRVLLGQVRARLA